MAVFQAFNAAGVGFNMSSTGSSGWAFIGADPSVTTDLVYDNGAVAGYDIYGSALVDYFTARYWSDGYTVIVHGDTGADKLYGFWGDDDLYGGAGRDALTGGAGSDYLSGGADSDRLTGD